MGSLKSHTLGRKLHSRESMKIKMSRRRNASGKRWRRRTSE